jgi:adenosylmethionine-8-amino-7-oxononanoate aminotransferase
MGIMDDNRHLRETDKNAYGIRSPRCRNRKRNLVIIAKGRLLAKTSGRWYLDGVSSMGEHLRPQERGVDEAIGEQQDSHSTMLGCPRHSWRRGWLTLSIPGSRSTPQDALFWGAEACPYQDFLFDNGSTAVELRSKYLQYWKQRLHGKNGFSR